MAVTVTMLQTRRGEDGNLWTVGNSYSATDAFAAVLISSNLAIGTLPKIPQSGEGVLMLNIDATTASAARVNAAAIQAAVQQGRTVRLRNPSTGTVAAYCDPFRLPSGTRLTVDEGLVLRRADGVNAPLIKGANTGQLLPGTRFVRASNVVTVSNRHHGLAAGRLVWVSNLTDTSMNGIQTVAGTLDAHTWTYASTGSNGSGGASSNFGYVIPLTRTMAGASFVSASDVVTVTDPGHDLRPGMNVWLGTTGASTAYCGIVEVIAVWPGFWQYYKTGTGSAAAVGTIAVCYERDIVIDGYGAIDGNAVNNSTVQDVDRELSLMSLGMLNQSRISIKQAGGTIFRVLTMDSPADVVVEDVEYYDTLVGTQVEGSGARTRFYKNRGGTGKWVSGAQQVDDAIAFTGTKVIGGQLYDSTASPYGLGAFLDCGVFDLDAPTCLNGIKLTADASCYVDNLVVDGVTGGLANFNITPFSGSAGIRYVDDGAGQIGMVCGRLFVRNVKWNGGANAFQWLCTGTADLLDIDGVEYTISAPQLAAGGTNIGSALNFASTQNRSGGRIKNLRIDNVVEKVKASNKPGIILGSGLVAATEAFTVDRLEIGRGVVLTVGGNFSSGSGIIKYANATVLHAIVRATFIGPDSGTGHCITTYTPNVGIWEWDGVSVIDGGTAMSFLQAIAIGDNAACAGKIIFRGGALKSISGIYDNNANFTGTLTVCLEAADTSAISNNLFNMNVTTAALSLLASPDAVVPADKVIGTVGGGATLRVNGPSIKLDGNKVTAPAAGDMFWNTNASMTGSASVGMKARTNAGAWASLF